MPGSAELGRGATRRAARPAHRRHRVRRRGAAAPDAHRGARRPGDGAGAARRARPPAPSRIAKLLKKPIFADVVEAAGGVEELMAARVAVRRGRPGRRARAADRPRRGRALRRRRLLRPAGRRGLHAPTCIGARDLLADRRGPARPGRDIHYVHISTAYVAGRRRGSIPEAPVEHDVDLEAELAWGLGQRAGDRAPLPRRRGARPRERKKAEKEHSRAGLLTAAAPPRRPASSGSRTSWSGSAPSGPAASAGPTATPSPRRWASASSRSTPREPTGSRSCGRASSSPPSSARTRAGSRASRWPSR